MKFVRYCLVIGIIASLTKVAYEPFKAHWYRRKAKALCRYGWFYSQYTYKKAAIATHFLSKSLKYNYHDWETHFLLGLAYSKLKHHQKAEEAYIKSLRLNLGHTRTHYNLGNVYYRMKKYEQASRCYVNCLEIDGDFIQAKKNLEIANSHKHKEVR